MKLVDLIGYAANDNIRAFLRVIREGETNQTDDAYRMRFGGELIDPGLAWHPGGTVKRLLGGKAIESSACGAYQFLARTWEGVAHEIGLANFGPASQDLAAIYLIARRGALQDVLAGNFEEAVRKCSSEWASLPGSPYGQPTLTLERAKAVYERFGGRYSPVDGAPAPTQPQAPDAPPAPIVESAPVSETGIDLSRQGKPMAPLILAALETAIQAAPTLIRIFGSGENAARNAKAVEVISDIVTKSTGASDIVSGAQKLSDPQAAEALEKAAQERHFELSEVSALIDKLDQQDAANRAAAAERAKVEDASGDLAHFLTRSTSGFLAGMIAILAAVAVAQVVWSADHKPAGEIIGAIVFLLGAFQKERSTQNDYRFGTSASSQAKDAVIRQLSK